MPPRLPDPGARGRRHPRAAVAVRPGAGGRRRGGRARLGRSRRRRLPRHAGPTPRCAGRGAGEAPVRRAARPRRGRARPNRGREGRPPDLCEKVGPSEKGTGMTHLLAVEGGYQVFHLGGAEKAWLLVSGLTALLAIGVGFALMRGVLAADQGTPTMIEIATAIQEGALAYLKRQFRTIVVILVPLAALVFLTSTRVVNPGNGHVALSFAQSGLFRTLAFLAGCLMSGLTGFIGMSLAVRGNVRTAAAARGGSLPAALRVAFRTGGVCGMFTVGLGLFGATIIIAIFQNTASAILVGFGFGGSLLALFLRVGGGIFTKAADVGADLVGKVEAGIPEDDPRNPATIADNVGDNVGDCAGMAADLFESYEVTLVASIILGVPAFQAIFPDKPALWAAGALFPLAARALGVLASIVGVFAVRATDRDKSAMAPINRGFLTAGLLTIVGTLALALIYVGNPAGELSGVGWRMFGAVVTGLVLA